MKKLEKILLLMVLLGLHTKAYAQLSPGQIDMIMHIGHIVFGLSDPTGYSSNFRNLFIRNCGMGQCTDRQICDYLNIGSSHPIDCSYATDKISYFDPKEVAFNSFLHALPPPQSCMEAVINAPGRLIIDIDGKGNRHWFQCFEDKAVVSAPYIANKEEVLRMLGFDAAPMEPGRLYGFETGRFFRIDPTSSHSHYLSGGWDNLQAATFHQGFIYAMQNKFLHQVNPATGAYTVLGNQVWTLGAFPSHLVSFRNSLFALHNGTLFSIQPDDGSYLVLGAVKDWLGATSMAASTNALYIVQNNRLHEVNPNTGSWRVIGGADWGGSTSMQYYNGWLYIVQAGSLHRVNPASGDWTLLGQGGVWNGTTSMGLSEGSLYIVQNSTLHRVSPESATWQVIGSIGSRNRTFVLGR